MSDEGMLEVKQALARMNEEERREISFYLQKLRHESREWKREMGVQCARWIAGRRCL